MTHDICSDREMCDGLVEFGLLTSIADYANRFGTHALAAFLATEGRERGFSVKRTRRRRGRGHRQHVHNKLASEARAS